MQRSRGLLWEGRLQISTDVRFLKCYFQESLDQSFLVLVLNLFTLLLVKENCYPGAFRLRLRTLLIQTNPAAIVRELMVLPQKPRAHCNSFCTTSQPSVSSLMEAAAAQVSVLAERKSPPSPCVGRYLTHSFAGNNRDFALGCFLEEF